MRLAEGAQARCETGLRLRKGPGTGYAIVATLKVGVLMRLLADPAGGWAKVEANGYTLDGRIIYSEPDAASSVEATRGGLAWEQITLTGYVGVGYLTVTDGPA